MVERLSGIAGEASHGADVEDDTTLLASLGVLLSHDPQGSLAHIGHAPEVGVKDGASLCIAGCLGDPGEGIARVVDDDVYAAELV